MRKGCKRQIPACRNALLEETQISSVGGALVGKFACTVDIRNGVSRHVETVCLLSNRKPDSYVHLNLKMEDYYRIKDAQKE